MSSLVRDNFEIRYVWPRHSPSPMFVDLDGVLLGTSVPLKARTARLTVAERWGDGVWRALPPAAWRPTLLDALLRRGLIRPDDHSRAVREAP
jgi:lysozyme family protein